jgi:hypothetical protein
MFLFEENEGLVFNGQNNNRLIGIDEELVKNVKSYLMRFQNIMSKNTLV